MIAPANTPCLSRLFIPMHCTGCGKCEQACVLEEAAIKVLPMDLAKGELGQHYRWGWEEKQQQAGESLVPADEQHRLQPARRHAL